MPEREPAYVTDSLRLSLYGAEDGSGDPLENLVSGAAVEVLERDTNYSHVRTAAGREGWVKTAFLVNTKPARARLAELEAEITDLKNDVAAARDAQHAAEEQIGKLSRAASTPAPTEALQAALDRARRENLSYEEQARELSQHAASDLGARSLGRDAGRWIYRRPMVARFADTPAPRGLPDLLTLGSAPQRPRVLHAHAEQHGEQERV